MPSKSKTIIQGGTPVKLNPFISDACVWSDNNRDIKAIRTVQDLFGTIHFRFNATNVDRIVSIAFVAQRSGVSEGLSTTTNINQGRNVFTVVVSQGDIDKLNAGTGDIELVMVVLDDKGQTHDMTGACIRVAPVMKEIVLNDTSIILMPKRSYDALPNKLGAFIIDDLQLAIINKTAGNAAVFTLEHNAYPLEFYIHNKSSANLDFAEASGVTLDGHLTVRPTDMVRMIYTGSSGRYISVLMYSEQP